MAQVLREIKDLQEEKCAGEPKGFFKKSTVTSKWVAMLIQVILIMMDC